MVPPASHRVPRVPWYSGSCHVNSYFAYRTLTVYGPLSQNCSAILVKSLPQSATPKYMYLGLGSFPFARRYLGNRCFFLFLALLRCFSSGGSLPYVMYWRTDDRGLLCRVSPFGYLRINGYVLLPEAFRSLSRPSSALSAKASTLRSFCLTIVVIVSLTWCSVTMQRFLGSPHCFLSLYDIKQRLFDVLSISLFLRALSSDKTRCVGYISYHVCSFQGTNYFHPVFKKDSGSHLLFHTVSSAVPSAA